MQNSDDSPAGPDDREEPGVDPTEATFQDWIDHVADTEGVPPKAVRARLMSSYWILDELSHQIEGASFEDLSDELADQEFTAGGSDGETDRIRTILEELVQDARSMEPRQTPDPEQHSWERLVEIVESLDGVTARPDAEPEATGSTPDRGLEQLDQAVRELEGHVDELQRRTAERHDELSAQVADIDGALEQSVEHSELEAVEERLSELESSLETVAVAIDRLDATVSEQSEDVTDIDERLGAHADRIQSLQETLSTLPEQLRALEEHVGTNRDRLDRFETTVDDHADHVQELRGSVATHEEDLDKVEEVLRYLFGELDRLEDRTAVVGDVVRDLEPVVEAHYERETVDALKAAAARNGSRTAECETCEESVDIGLLTEPACPHCGTRADDVTSRSGLLRSKAVLETTDEPARSDWEWATELKALDLDRDVV